MLINKNSAVISILILLILIAWIYFVRLVVAPFYLQKQPTNYKRYGNTLSNYIRVALKDKPIADYKIPEKYASTEIDISKIVKFKWDKAVIYNSSGYSARICSELSLDKNECSRSDFDELAKTNKYFITFTHKNSVVYIEIFEDEILLFGINTIGRKMTPADSVMSAYRDMTVMYRKDDARKQKYSDITVFIAFPILGFFFGFRFFYPSLIIGAVLFAPIVLFFLALNSGTGNPLGLVFFVVPAATSMFAGVGMFIGAIFNKFSYKSKLN